MIPVLSYNALSDASTYFNSRLHVEDWDEASSDDQQKALNDARRIIDVYYFIGSKAVSSQPFEWPRSGIQNLDSSAVPTPIKEAECEIALVLLSGFDVEKQANSLNISHRSFTSIRTSYDLNATPEHLRARCPSDRGWILVKQFINPDSLSVILRRAN